MHLIEAVLGKLLKIAKARATLLGKLGMGDNWVPSPQYPAIVAIIDEYPQLSQAAKALVVALLRVGRKARVQVGLAAQEATKDSIGAAIADSIALKIVGPSRHQDIVQVFGAGAGANGYRPDRLHPAEGEDPADAGKAYIMGAGQREPLIHKFIAIDSAEAKERAAARAAAGRPWIDDESLQAAGVTFDDLDQVKPHAALPEAVELARLAFTAAGDPERMTSEEIYDYVSSASETWAPQEEEEQGKALARFQDALRKQAAQINPDVDMKTKQWRGGRGYYLAKLLELTGDSDAD
jgi:S-DNA-T family DNA segregation ATPase FtsK/SpoIIIE